MTGKPWPTRQGDLFMAYPNHPGTEATTSETIVAEDPPRKSLKIRGVIYNELRQGDFTNQQLAQRTGLHYESITPRTSELKSSGLVVDTGRKGPARSPDHRATVWARAKRPA